MKFDAFFFGVEKKPCIFAALFKRARRYKILTQ